MEKEIEFLVKQVKELRWQQADLQRRLDERENQFQQVASGQLPLAELGRLTAGIVHDMRNGLGVARNTIGFLEHDLTDETHRADLLKISQSLDFCELVLRNLSVLGGQDVFQPQRVNLKAIVREVYSILERKLVDVALVVDADSTVPEILADEGQMKQVFMNLMKNAGAAMPDGGTLTLCMQREGQMLCVEVSDTGDDMSSLDQERFDVATKEWGYSRWELHIVRTIVERHGGTLEMRSQPGKGTTFVLRLPIE
jgi:signal transduction histidine kinase